MGVLHSLHDTFSLYIQLFIPYRCKDGFRGDLCEEKIPIPHMTTKKDTGYTTVELILFGVHGCVGLIALTAFVTSCYLCKKNNKQKGRKSSRHSIERGNLNNSSHWRSQGNDYRNAYDTRYPHTNHVTINQRQADHVDYYNFPGNLLHQNIHESTYRG